MKKYTFRVKTIKKMSELRKIYKVCTNCKKLLPIKDFNKSKGRRGQKTFESRCRKCKYELSKKTKICQICGKEYKTQRKEQLYCSNECASKVRVTKLEIRCDYCNKKYDIKKSQYNRSEHHFCSKECMGKWQSENLNKENSPLFTSIKHNCDYCGKEFYIPKREYEKKTNHFCSKECMGEWRKGRFCGENSSRWNPNITNEERELGRHISGIDEWRKSVYERDNYTCQCCGDDKGGNLNAHHLNGYNWDKEHRTDVDNGITLCEECHKKFHKIYGKGNNTKEQFEYFIKNERGS